MSTTNALKSTTYKFLGRKDLIALAAESLSPDSKILLVCDLDAEGEKNYKAYLKALQDADLLSEEQANAVTSANQHLVMVPFNTMTVAESVYRQIPHASHFVSLWLDGEPYSNGC